MKDKFWDDETSPPRRTIAKKSDVYLQADGIKRFAIGDKRVPETNTPASSSWEVPASSSKEVAPGVKNSIKVEPGKESEEVQALRAENESLKAALKVAQIDHSKKRKKILDRTESFPKRFEIEQDVDIDLADIVEPDRLEQVEEWLDKFEGDNFEDAMDVFRDIMGDPAGDPEEGIGAAGMGASSSGRLPESERAIAYMLRTCHTLFPNVYLDPLPYEIIASQLRKTDGTNPSKQAVMKLVESMWKQVGTEGEFKRSTSGVGRPSIIPLSQKLEIAYYMMECKRTQKRVNIEWCRTNRLELFEYKHGDPEETKLISTSHIRKIMQEHCYDVDPRFKWLALVPKIEKTQRTEAWRANRVKYARTMLELDGPHYLSEEVQSNIRFQFLSNLFYHNHKS